MRLNPHKPWRAKVQSLPQFPRNYHHLCFSFSALPSHTCCICPMSHGFPQKTQTLEILARLQGKAEMKGGRLPTLFSKWRTIGELNGELLFKYRSVPISESFSYLTQPQPPRHSHFSLSSPFPLTLPLYFQFFSLHFTSTATNTKGLERFTQVFNRVLFQINTKRNSDTSCRCHH